MAKPAKLARKKKPSPKKPVSRKKKKLLVKKHGLRNKLIGVVLILNRSRVDAKKSCREQKPHSN
jgi:uncharacterized membrane protein